MSMTKENSLTVGPGGTSERVVVGAAASAPTVQSATNDGEYWVVTVDALMFVRKGAAPVAVVNNDQVLLANQMYRIGPLSRGDKLAFFSTPGGNAYITPSA